MLQVSPEEMRSRMMPPRQARTHVLRRAGLAIAALLVLVAVAAGVWIAVRHAAPTRPVLRLDIGKPPPPLPARLQEGFMRLDPAKAEEINGTIAASTAPIEIARPFLLPATVANIVSQHAAVDCLTAAIYYEAASESQQGQSAVAQVVLNRVRHPAYPKSVCGVVYEGAARRTGCQFSFTCDGSLARKPSTFGWARARLIARAALAGAVEPSVGTATHYHTNYVVPYWAWSLDKITTVGAHIFYRWKGFWGRRGAFTGTYAGESDATPAAPLLPYDPGALADIQADTAAALSGPRPLADELGRPAPAPPIQAGPAFQPHADQQRGALVADENRGALIEGARAGD